MEINNLQLHHQNSNLPYTITITTSHSQTVKLMVLDKKWRTNQHNEHLLNRLKLKEGSHLNTGARFCLHALNTFSTFPNNQTNL